MHGPAKAMAVCALACLVAVSLYSAALGSSGRLWCGWAVLGLCAAGVAATRPRR